ncbi:MAG: aryldialkylphosphatase [Verrucomicrobia bacterium]|nr:aryldialkylphosphatase [Verrucomicrobiota bacterium]
MVKSKMAGKVQTVLGPVEPDALGATLTHEHLLFDASTIPVAPPDEASERSWKDAPFTMERRGGLAKRFLGGCHNNELRSVDVAIHEALRFKHAGGGTLVDVTSGGLCRDPLGLARISRAAGLNIVMGGSYYMPVAHPPGTDRRPVDSIAQEIIRDITVGVGETGVRMGVIGEVGNMWPARPVEATVLKASAQAALETGAKVLIHPGYHLKSPPHVIETLVKAKLPPEQIIMGHLDAFHDRAWLRDLTQMGTFLEWDLFGLEDSELGAVAGQPVDFGSDVQRLDDVEFALSQGCGERVVLGHDVCTQFQLTRNGGKGYAHILENIVPRMRKRGFTETQVHNLLVANPARALAFR